MNKMAVNVLAAVFSVGAFGPLMFMALDREPPYERIAGKISPDDPAAGGIIEVEWAIRTNRICAPAANRNVSRRIIDSHKVVWDFEETPSVYGRELSANPDRIVRVFALPAGIAGGTATYHSSACFSCWPIQQLWPICIDHPDIAFTVRATPSPNPGPAGPIGPQGPQGPVGPRGP